MNPSSSTSIGNALKYKDMTSTVVAVGRSLSCVSDTFSWQHSLWIFQLSRQSAQLPEAIGTPIRGPHNSSNFDRSHFLETVNDSHKVVVLAGASVHRQIHPGSEQDSRSSHIFLDIVGQLFGFCWQTTQGLVRKGHSLTQAWSLSCVTVRLIIYGQVQSCFYKYSDSSWLQSFFGSIRRIVKKKLWEN